MNATSRINVYTTERFNTALQNAVKALDDYDSVPTYKGKPNVSEILTRALEALPLALAVRDDLPGAGKAHAFGMVDALTATQRSARGEMDVRCNRPVGRRA